MQCNRAEDALSTTAATQFPQIVTVLSSNAAGNDKATQAPLEHPGEDQGAPELKWQERQIRNSGRFGGDLTKPCAPGEVDQPQRDDRDQGSPAALQHTLGDERSAHVSQ